MTKRTLDRSVEIVGGPEKNEGRLITQSDSFRLSWIKKGERVVEVSRLNFDGKRNLFIPQKEYLAHLAKAKSAFASRQ
jgi:hypothetical protein